MTERDDFATLAERHRREVHVHCYRMLASYDEADDAVQETMIRAWRSRDRFDGSELRAWLYRIATNVCLDSLRARRRRARSHTFAEIPWLQPYPDSLLDAVSADDPETTMIERETIELAFLAALQVLPPRQRAALIARDVIGWSAAETAAQLDTSVAAANSALQRARETMRRWLPPTRSQWAPASATDEEEALLDRFIDAHERCDVEAALAIAAEDIRITMPPAPYLFDGIGEAARLLKRGFENDREGDWKLLPTACNRLPAAAAYLRRPGDPAFRAFKLDVLRVVDGEIAEITTFGYSRFPVFGLPMTL